MGEKPISTREPAPRASAQKAASLLPLFWINWRTAASTAQASRRNTRSVFHEKRYAALAIFGFTRGDDLRKTNKITVRAAGTKDNAFLQTRSGRRSAMTARKTQKIKNKTPGRLSAIVSPWNVEENPNSRRCGRERD